MAAVKKRFTRARLETDGFVGWVTFGKLDEMPADHVPSAGGLYVVLREGGGIPVSYLDVNPGGRFKGRDPTVTTEALDANWADGASVVYIGKGDNLHRRLREYVLFGQGAPVGHWGGRLIWHLADSARLLVAWKTTPGEVPKVLESQLIKEFRSTYGKPPFANEPHRLGS